MTTDHNTKARLEIGATADLITTATTDTATEATDQAALAAAQAAVAAAGTVVTSDDLAVYTDLTANGPALVITTNTDGTVTYQVATAVPPGSFTLTTIRPA